jgi:AcrR family transcriptional regulator
MQAVADRAGVGLPALYRRWPSKVELVHAAVFARAEYAELDPDAPFAEQVRTYVGVVLRSFGEPARRVAILALLQDAAADPELLTRLATANAPATASLFESMIATAAACGEIAADADPEMMLTVIVGSALNACLGFGVDDSGPFADQLTAFVLRAVAP